MIIALCLSELDDEFDQTLLEHKKRIKKTNLILI